MKALRIALLTGSLAVAAVANADERAVTAVFTADEISIITRYYQATAQPRQGRRGAERLPRGIAKNLTRGKPLPPGIAKRGLPADLTVRLPPPPAGYERIVVAGKILLVEIATQVVHDVLTDVLFR
jgi:Ni/Co efflux regulator RcnB